MWSTFEEDSFFSLVNISIISWFISNVCQRLVYESKRGTSYEFIYIVGSSLYQLDYLLI
jgi:hypothetical protein